MTDAIKGTTSTSLLRQAHKGVEAMSAAAALIKQEQWVEAERALARSDGRIMNVFAMRPFI